MKIFLERDKCIGCGSCQALCPKFWKMGEDGKTNIIGADIDNSSGNEELKVDKPGCNEDAANACPAQCIHIVK